MNAHHIGKVVAAIILFAGTVVEAAEPPTPAPAASESAEQPKPATTPAATPAPAATTAPAPATTAPAAAAAPTTPNATSPAATPQRFLPSEEVRADFDVSFPIDI